MDLCGAPGPAASFSLPSHSPKALSRPGSSRHITVLAPAPAVSKSTHPLHRHSLEAPAGLPDLLPSPQNDFLQSRSGQATPLSPPPAAAPSVPAPRSAMACPHGLCLALQGHFTAWCSSCLWPPASWAFVLLLGWAHSHPRTFAPCFHCLEHFHSFGSKLNAASQVFSGLQL